MIRHNKHCCRTICLASAFDIVYVSCGYALLVRGGKTMKAYFAAVYMCLVVIPACARAQQIFPYRETFDTARVPLLPAGWSATHAKLATGDFATSLATPLSAPLAALSTDARIAQCLITPALSFSGRIGDSLNFYERRSATYTAGMLVEVSVQEDTASWITFSDTLKLVSSTSYIHRTLHLPAVLNGRPSVRFRWRTLGNGTGSTGTLRLDDVCITVQHTIDLALDAFVDTPFPVASGDNAICTVTVRNKASAGNYACSLAMIDSTLGVRIADTAFVHFFGIADSFAVSMLYPRIGAGMHTLGFVLSLPSDEDTSNNTAVAAVAVSSPAHALVINEIMYEPAPGAPEYVELYNRSGSSVDIAGWNMGDASGTEKNRVTISLPHTPHIIPSNSMCVVATDSSVITMMNTVQNEHPNIIIVSSLGLNNSGDDIILFDPAGTTVDSINFSPSWHLPKTTTVGKSLERVNPHLPGTDARNWSTAVSLRGGTPGAQNSIFTSALPVDASLMLSPNPFSPDNDGVEDFLGITYSLPATANELRVRIYDAAGRLVRTLANNEPGASTGTIIWNGRDGSNTRVRMGMYIVFVEALEPRGGVLRALKGVAVVATKLE